MLKYYTNDTYYMAFLCEKITREEWQKGLLFYEMIKKNNFWKLPAGCSLQFFFETWKWVYMKFPNDVIEKAFIKTGSYTSIKEVHDQCLMITCMMIT